MAGNKGSSSAGIRVRAAAPRGASVEVLSWEKSCEA